MDEFIKMLNEDYELVRYKMYSIAYQISNF